MKERWGGSVLDPCFVGIRRLSYGSLHVYCSRTCATWHGYHLLWLMSTVHINLDNSYSEFSDLLLEFVSNDQSV